MAHTLAMMAGGITGPVQGAASHAGMQTQIPEGSASIIQGMPSTASAHMWANWANQYGSQARAEAMAYDRNVRTQTSLSTLKYLGFNAHQRVGDANAISTQKKVGQEEQFNKIANSMGMTSTQFSAALEQKGTGAKAQLLNNYMKAHPDKDVMAAAGDLAKVSGDKEYIELAKVPGMIKGAGRGRMGRN